MSYTPTVWQTGDTITAEKLNKMEGGIENANTPLVVTCTPDSPDFSGTMDKTVAEIDTAYNAGQTVLFRVLTGIGTYSEVHCSIVTKDSGYSYPAYGGFTIDINTNVLIYAWTPYTDLGDNNNYGTHIYPLTPMGG